MKIAVLSDIHSNAIALQAVLKDIDSIPDVSDIWCLGDILGCGPDPHTCFSLLGSYNAVALKGETDKGIVSRIYPPYVTGITKKFWQWESDVLTLEERNFINKLPEKLAADDFTLVHGSPRLPLSEGIVSNGVASSNLTYFDTRYCLVGHTRECCMFVQIAGGACKFRSIEPGVKYQLTSDRMIINPGSVGSSKDRDYRAAYGLIDFSDMTYEQKRIEYDLTKLEAQFRELELPYEFYINISRGI